MSFSFKNLPEVEFENYIKDQFGETEEYKENEKKNHLLKEFKKLLSETEKIQLGIQNTYDSIYESNYKKAAFYGSDALKKSNHVTYRIRRLLAEFGIEEELTLSAATSFDVIGQIEGEILHLILPDLLPDKVKEGESKRYAEIAHTYLTAFQKFFSSGRFPVYESKAVIVFYHYYKNEKFLKDHDNFETKQIIDILSAFLLTDDNPKWCSNFMDYRMGDTNHTEIYIVPESQFIDFLKNKNTPFSD